MRIINKNAASEALEIDEIFNVEKPSDFSYFFKGGITFLTLVYNPYQKDDGTVGENLTVRVGTVKREDHRPPALDDNIQSVYIPTAVLEIPGMDHLQAERVTVGVHKSRGPTEIVVHGTIQESNKKHVIEAMKRYLDNNNNLEVSLRTK